MAFGFQRRSYVAVLVTLTSANTPYNILTLVNAVLAAETQGDNTMQAPGTARELTLSAYGGIDGAGANTNDILVGDSLISTTRMGYVLPTGSSRTYRSANSDVMVGGIYVQSAGAGQKLNVEITPF